MLTVGSLFAGIGGFDLGLERAGMQVKWQVEIDPYAQRVLEKHWPGVKRYGDIRNCGAGNLERVDVICGGFPCQDISPAGKRVGISGSRSGLWSEMFRIIGELRPRYVIVENSSDLIVRGLERVVGDLASARYDAEWSVLSACAFGAPHTRERVFLVAYPESERGWRECRGLARPAERNQERDLHQWGREPPGPRVAHGIPDRTQRRRAVGNSIVPHIAEWIGRRIVEAADAVDPHVYSTGKLTTREE